MNEPACAVYDRACNGFFVFAKPTVGRKWRCIVHSHRAEGIFAVVKGMRYTTRTTAPKLRDFVAVCWEAASWPFAGASSLFSSPRCGTGIADGLEQRSYCLMIPYLYALILVLHSLRSAPASPPTPKFVHAGKLRRSGREFFSPSGSDGRSESMKRSQAKAAVSPQ